MFLAYTWLPCNLLYGLQDGMTLFYMTVIGPNSAHGYASENFGSNPLKSMAL